MNGKFGEFERVCIELLMRNHDRRTGFRVKRQRHVQPPQPREALRACRVATLCAYTA